jgi:hypothetical protein
MKMFMKPTRPEVQESGNFPSARLTRWARQCLRLFSTVAALSALTASSLGADIVPGLIKREVWASNPGRAAIENGTAGAPSEVTFETSFEAPVNVANNYCQRMSGVFIPPANGNYNFVISSDDDSDLFLSTDSTPANKRLIAQQPGWNASREWLTDAGGANTNAKRNSSTFDVNGTTPYAGGITLTAGQPYYIEAVMHEGGGGDNLAVAAYLVGSPAPGDGDDAAIPTAQVGIRSAAAVTVAITPGNTTAYVGTSVGFKATITPGTDDNVTYTWKTNGVVAAGVTNSAYLTPNLSTTDNGLKVEVSVALEHSGATASSSQSTITVAPTGQQTANGFLKWEFIPGVSRQDVEVGNAPAPSFIRPIRSFETPVNFGGNFVSRVSGYISTPTAGDYVFAVSSDDDTDLFLSTDMEPSKKRLIAQQPGWNASREWATDAGGGAMNPQRYSNTWVPDPTNPPATPPYAAGIHLDANQKYYIEAVQHEGGGGDNLAVTMYLLNSATPPNGTTPPANGSASTLTGNLISYSAAPTATTLTITKQPTSATVTEGSNTNFTVTVTTDSAIDPVYQWRRNGVDISGANSSTYAVSPAKIADNGAVYSVVVSIPGSTLTQTSQNATLTVNGGVFAEGFLKREFWQGASGVGITLAAVNDGSVGPPTSVGSVTSFEAPTNVGADYAQRISGFFIPAEDNDYVFIINSDDQSQLFLSTDEDPAHKHLIAEDAGWDSARAWNAFHAPGTAEDKRSDTYSLTQWPGGTPGATTISLKKDTRYYIEAVMREGGGGDNLAVTILTPDDVAAGRPADNDAPLLPGKIGLTVPQSTVTITTQPTSQVADEGRTATFTAAATTDSQFGAPSFQWQRNGVDIPGATSASYTTPRLTLGNNNDTYRVVVGAPGATPKTSSAGTLTVNPDRTPPTLLSAGSLKTFAGGNEVSLIFDEALSPTSTSLGNFTINNGAAFTAARIVTNSSGLDTTQAGIILTATGITPGSSYTVTVQGVSDIPGNPINPAQSKTFTASKFGWVALGDTANGVKNEALAIGTNNFNVVNGGNAFWNAEDDITMVYEPVTGDFDRQVQVDWNDPSSFWARAGLSARESLNNGLPTTDSSGDNPASRYQMILSDPMTRFDGAAANDGWESNRRVNAGGPTSSLAGVANVVDYPDSYVRLKRVGNRISVFYSTNFTTWHTLGTTDFDVDSTDAPLPADLFVGPTMGAENGNITGQGGTTDQQGVFASRFRNYGSVPQKPLGTETYAIGLNLGANEGGSQLSATDVAGVDKIAQANWNNIFGNDTATTPAGPIVANNGSATPVTVDISGSGNTWASQGPRGENNSQMNGNDAVLMTGYLDTGDATTTKVQISSIPAALTSAGYDVVVYALGGVGNKGGSYRVTDVAGNVLTGADYVAFTALVNPTNYVAVGSNATTPKNGNYIVFKNLKADTIIVEATTENGLGTGSGPRAPINAIQLVTPSGLTDGNGGGGSTISISRNGGNVTISSSNGGTVQATSSLNPPVTWQDLGPAPQTVPTSSSMQFFRVKN